MSDIALGQVAPGVLPRRGLGWLSGRGTLLAGAALAVAIVAGCFAGSALWPPDPAALHPADALSPPSWAYPLGTDELGRDELARLLSGGNATLLVALPGALLAFVVGLLYGLASALGPRWLDRVLMRLLDTVLALPTLVVLIFAASLVRLDTPNLIGLIGFLAWPGLARLVRNEAAAHSKRDFMLASRQFGAGAWYLGRVHLVRMLAPLLVVNATFLVGDAIFALSALSFLSLGVQPPQASWGELLQDGLNLVALNPWWLILAPGLAIFASLLATSLVGQGLLASGRGQ